MARNKLSKDLERIARENGLIGTAQTTRGIPVPSPESPPVQVTHNAMMVCFTKPPTVNNLFLSSGRRRVKTPAYREWIEANKEEAALLRKPVAFPITMCYRLCGKFRRSADGGNYEKPVVDLLVSQGVIPDDSLMYVTGGRWEYTPSAAEPTVLVWWEEPK